jgi:hypothetical protein
VPCQRRGREKTPRRIRFDSTCFVIRPSPTGKGGPKMPLATAQPPQCSTESSCRQGSQLWGPDHATPRRVGGSLGRLHPVGWSAACSETEAWAASELAAHLDHPDASLRHSAGQGKGRGRGKVEAHDGCPSQCQRRQPGTLLTACQHSSWDDVIQAFDACRVARRAAAPQWQWPGAPSYTIDRYHLRHAI